MLVNFSLQNFNAFKKGFKRKKDQVTRFRHVKCIDIFKYESLFDPKYVEITQNLRLILVQPPMTQPSLLTEQVFQMFSLLRSNFKLSLFARHRLKFFIFNTYQTDY